MFFVPLLFLTSPSTDPNVLFTHSCLNVTVRNGGIFRENLFQELEIADATPNCEWPDMSSTTLPQLVICLLNRKEGTWSWDFNALGYPGCCFRFLSSLYTDPRPTAEGVSAFGQHRKLPPHTRKTSGTQGSLGQEPAVNSWADLSLSIRGQDKTRN